MINYLRLAGWRIRDVAWWAGQLVRPYRGTHEADSLSDAGWHEDTPRPSDPPAMLSAPRISPRILTVADRVMSFYDAADIAMRDAINATIEKSRYDWLMSYGR